MYFSFKGAAKYFWDMKIVEKQFESWTCYNSWNIISFTDRSYDKLS